MNSEMAYWVHSNFFSRALNDVYFVEFPVLCEN